MAFGSVMRDNLGLLASTENAKSIQYGTKVPEFVINLSTCQMFHRMFSWHICITFCSFINLCKKRSLISIVN